MKTLTLSALIFLNTELATASFAPADDEQLPTTTVPQETYTDEDGFYNWWVSLGEWWQRIRPTREELVVAQYVAIIALTNSKD